MSTYTAFGSPDKITLSFYYENNPDLLKQKMFEMLDEIYSYASVLFNSDSRSLADNFNKIVGIINSENFSNERNLKSGESNSDTMIKILDYLLTNLNQNVKLRTKESFNKFFNYIEDYFQNL
jgi:hypothetical protein